MTDVTNAELDAISRAEKLLAELKSYRSISFSEEEVVDILPALIALAKDGLRWRRMMAGAPLVLKEMVFAAETKDERDYILTRPPFIKHKQDSADAPAAAEDGECE